MKKRHRILLLLFFGILINLTGCSEKISEVIQQTRKIDPWVYIQDNSISKEVPIRDFASSSSQLGLVIGIIGIVFSILYIALRILLTSSAKKRQEIKQEVWIKGIIGIMLFSIPFWLSLFQLIGKSLV